MDARIIGSGSLSRRRLIAAALGSAGAALLAACGQAPSAPTAPAKGGAEVPTPSPAAGAQSAGAKPTAPAAEPTKPAPAPAAKEPPKPGETEVIWTSWATDTYGMFRVQEQAALFAKERPEIKINIRNTASQGYREQVLTQLAGGVGADVFRLAMSDVGPFAEQGQLKELDPLFKAEPSSWFFGEDLKPDIMDRMRFRGKLFGLPMGGEMDAMMINKTLFEKEGVAVPPTGYEDESWTFDKVLELATKLTKRRPDGGAEQFGIDAKIYHWMKAVVDNANDGRSWTSDDLSTFQGHEPGAVEGIQWLVDLALKHKVAATAAEAQGGAFDYANGRLALTWLGVSQASYRTVDVKDKFNWDVVPQPRWGKNKLQVYLEFSDWTINAKTKVLDAAWTFLHFINGPQGQVPDVELGWAIPIFKSLDGRYNSRIAEWKKNTRPAIDGLKYANWVWQSRNPGWSEAWLNHINPALQEVLAGKAKASEAMARIKPDVDKILKDGKARM